MLSAIYAKYIDWCNYFNVTTYKLKENDTVYIKGIRIKHTTDFTDVTFEPGSVKIQKYSGVHLNQQDNKAMIDVTRDKETIDLCIGEPKITLSYVDGGLSKIKIPHFYGIKATFISTVTSSCVTVET